MYNPAEISLWNIKIILKIDFDYDFFKIKIIFLCFTLFTKIQ